VPSATGQTFRLEGQITSGTTLFTVDELFYETQYDGIGFPEGGYPVDYVAFLTLNAEQQSWDFRFQATDALETVEHFVSAPLTSETTFANRILSTADALAIDGATYG